MAVFPLLFRRMWQSVIKVLEMNAPEERRITGLQWCPVCGRGILSWALFRFLIRLEKGDGEERNGNRQELRDTCTPEHFTFSSASLNVGFVGSNVEM